MAERKQTTVKGDQSRVRKYQDWSKNFDEIPNFGYKPKWARETEPKKKSTEPVDVLETESCTNDDLRDAGLI